MLIRLSRRDWRVYTLLPFMGLYLIGCAGPGPGRGFEPVDDELAPCRTLLAEFDRKVARAGVADGQSRRVDGFAYLRVNRTLAALKPAGPDAAGLGEWTQHLLMQDVQARAYEIANLYSLTPGSVAHRAELERQGRCATMLMLDELADGRRRQRLLDAAVVPSSYSLPRRILGLYPLSSLFVSAGISRLQQDILADFGSVEPGPGWRLYAPPVSAAEEIGGIGLLATEDRLTGLSRERLSALFARHAPRLLLQSGAEYDRPAGLVWADAGRLSVDTARPGVYLHLSHTRFEGRLLPQLNYVFWFSERPATSAVDLLSGRLDGLTWRVTLDPEGGILLYDVMHNCGCYHMFLPSPRLQARSDTQWRGEPPLILPWPEAVTGPVTLLLESGSHYLLDVRTDLNGGFQSTTYSLLDYGMLRSLPRPDGSRRSAFGPDGLIRGSERGERFLLWPTGVLSPGAMRQWGHHATAFVGQRHFDDPDLVDRYFRARGVGR